MQHASGQKSLAVPGGLVFKTWILNLLQKTLSTHTVPISKQIVNVCHRLLVFVDSGPSSKSARELSQVVVCIAMAEVSSDQDARQLCICVLVSKRLKVKTKKNMRIKVLQGSVTTQQSDRAGSDILQNSQIADMHGTPAKLVHLKSFKSQYRMWLPVRDVDID